MKLNFYNNFSILTTLIDEANSNEPFVVLDYNQGNNRNGKLNKDNIFVKNQVIVNIR